MNFLTPTALFLAIAPVFLCLYFIFKKRNNQLSTHLPLSAPASLIKKRSQKTKNVFRLFFAAEMIAILLFILVMARPATTRIWTKRWTEGIDIMLALDVSDSMDATDFKPNRIQVAKKVIRNFIEQRSDDRIGLVIFGGEAITKSPLTNDYQFLLNQLDEVRLRELEQGTAIGMAIANSVGRLRPSKVKNKVIILLTDGDSNVGDINPITASHLAKEEGIRIYSIGIGKRNRVVVPVWNHDKTVILTKVPSYLNPQLLVEISKITSGKAYMATDSNSLAKVLSEIDQLEKTKSQIASGRTTEDRFFYYALLATILMGIVYTLQETRFKKARRNYAATV